MITLSYSYDFLAKELSKFIEEYDLMKNNNGSIETELLNSNNDKKRILNKINKLTLSNQKLNYDLQNIKNEN